MTRQSHELAREPNQSPQITPKFSHPNDEVDLLAFMEILWKAKALILLVTVLFGLGAAIFAFSQPNEYKVSAKLQVSIDPYGFGETLGQNIGGRMIHDANLFYPILSSDKFQAITMKLAQRFKGSDLSITKDKQSGVITVTSYSTDKEQAYHSVSAYVEYANQALKSLQNVKSEQALQATKSLLIATSGKVNEALSERYAQQLYKAKLLENSSFKLVEVTQLPQLPTSYVKPKRARIITLGILLGGMLAVAWVLVRNAFKKL